MSSPQPVRPRIAVLLATYNGRRWLPEQVGSILDQRDVAVTLFVSDDGSTDGTVQWLADLAERDARVILLPSDVPSGSAAANFYRLTAHAPLGDAELVAFADQDDIWMPDKLSRHAALIREHGYHGVSSNITSFDELGRRSLVRKSYPQRRFDYLTESPGPGSTFLMTRSLVKVVREVLAADPLAPTAEYHDSLIYAVARARGLSWHIDTVSSVDYRQHDSNVMGSNVGLGSALTRLRLIRRKWHRGQAILHATVGLSVAPPAIRTDLERMLGLMSSRRIRDRFALALAAGGLRRRPRDRWVIGVLIALGVW